MSRPTRLGLLIIGAVLLAGLVFASAGWAEPLADIAKGKTAYDQSCAVCHGFEGKGGPIAPPLAKDLGFFKDAGVSQEIAAGLLIQATKQRPPGSMMPVYNPNKVNDADVVNITDYLWSLAPAGTPLPRGDVARGAQAYAANCASCHGDQGQGVSAPPLAAINAQLQAAGLPPNVMAGLVKLATRSGSLPTMPTFGPDKLSDGALADIARFIGTLPAPAGPPPTAPPAAPPRGGKALYDASCAVCHGFEGKGGPIGPPLAKDLIFFKEVGLPAQAVTGLLIQATRQRPPGAMMPVYNPGKVTDADVAEIGDYLWGLTPAPAAVIPPGNAQAGAAPYAANCAACHGAAGQGTAAGPPLAQITGGLKAGGAPAAVLHALVRLAARSGALPTMPTFGPDKLSDSALADIAAFVWELPTAAPPAAAAPTAPAPTGLPRTGDPMPSYLLAMGLLGAAALCAGVALRVRGRKHWKE